MAKKKIERTNNGSQSTTFKAKDFAENLLIWH
jgi:hypothetical protein